MSKSRRGQPSVPVEPKPVRNISDEITIDHLNTTIKNLNEKICLLEGKAAEVEELRKEIASSEKIRFDLSSCLKESGKRISVENQAEISFKMELIDKNKEIIDENQKLRQSLKESLNERNSLKSRIKEIMTKEKIMESNVNILIGKIKYEESIEITLNALESNIKELEKKSHMVIFAIIHQDNEALKNEQLQNKRLESENVFISYDNIDDVKR